MMKILQPKGLKLLCAALQSIMCIACGNQLCLIVHNSRGYTRISMTKDTLMFLPDAKSFVPKHA